MTYDKVYTRQWVTGTTASRELSHRIPRTIFGLQCGRRTITRKTKERKFDTRTGDILPRGRFTELTVCFAGSFRLTRVYIYPGQETEVPNFDHIARRRRLRSTQELMATVVPDGVYAVPLPMSQVVVFFDETITEPYVKISYITRQGFMIYDGPQGFDVELHFRDAAQQREYCFEFAPPPVEEENAA